MESSFHLKQNLVNSFANAVLRLGNPFCYQRLKKLRNDIASDRVFIVGNGPSLKKTDLSKLSEEHVCVTNRCHSLLSTVNWHPLYWVVANKGLIGDCAGQFNATVLDRPETKFFFPVSSSLKHDHEIEPIRRTNNAYFFRQRSHRFDHPDFRFSIDASKYLVSTYTVTISAMQLMAHLGYRTLILIGCDTNFNVTKEKLEKQWVKVSEADRLTRNDYYDPNYPRAAGHRSLPKPELMIKNYEVAKEECQANGVEVLNATVGGKLEVFDRVDLDELFK